MTEGREGINYDELMKEYYVLHVNCVHEGDGTGPSGCCDGTGPHKEVNHNSNMNDIAVLNR